MNSFNNKNIEKLKAFIKNEYEKDEPFFHFAITKIDFNCNERKPKLEVEVSHYKSQKKINFIFYNFLFHIVSNESDSLYFSNKSFEGFSMVYISAKYDIINLLKQKGYSHYFWATEKNPENFFIFRILAQNYFIDIYTDKLPEIEY